MTIHARYISWRFDPNQRTQGNAATDSSTFEQEDSFDQVSFRLLREVFHNQVGVGVSKGSGTEAQTSDNNNKPPAQPEQPATIQDSGWTD